MRAAIVVPPIEDFYYSPRRASSIGARVVDAVLRRSSCQTVFFDFPASRGRPARLPLPDALRHLAPYVLSGERGPTSFFTGYKRFGPSDEECACLILDSGADAAFFSVFAFAYADTAISLARAIKNKAPGFPIVIGGAGYSVIPEYFLRSCAFDAGLVGEAETVLPDFLGGEGIPSAKRPTGKKGLEIEPIVTVTYEKRDAVFASTVVSRGCPKQCSFCSTAATQGTRFRKAEIGGIIEAVSALPAGKRLFLNFEDDNALVDPDFFFAVIDGVRALRPDALFSAENGLDYSLLDEPALDRLIASGFRQFNLSLASTDPDVLASMNRGGDPRLLARLCAEIAERGIPSVVYFISALPGDSPERTIDAIRFIAGLPSLVGISPFYPVPGIVGYEDKNAFVDAPSIRCAGSSCLPWNGTLTTAQIVTAFRIARLANLAKKPGKSVMETELQETCFRERSLFTIVGSSGRLEPVDGLDEGMVSGFFA